jgi:hypothetical protein
VPGSGSMRMDDGETVSHPLEARNGHPYPVRTPC